ncbi:rhomboid family intramembrane serine protease [Trichocoleus sp. FACHB-262]|uniref:rhomboid family intramembrane serine protease n=1 Tax=Trichocoleus sp. FACHB-262 TaxID=2692869 RepID=UPI00168A3668|nr:rhomboid family intramembrane serine protease [Trichocoleus sp. FACHB-262]MBD2119873.1 rhomboid family intramembrane serine protease [Trichocoleus sp. FACHB-262]
MELKLNLITTDTNLPAWAQEINQISEQLPDLEQNFETQATILGGLLLLIWALEIIDFLIFQGALNRFGIRPRSLRGLSGIILAPFLHGSFKHLAANSMPLVTLGWLVMLQDVHYFFVVSAVTVLVSGLGVWLFGATRSVHLGASGLIFGYLGFLLLYGYFERSLWTGMVSLFVGLFYGGLIWGILPSRRGVSWLGHLFGFVGGILAAHLLS